jgi:hypothetical protein
MIWLVPAAAGVVGALAIVVAGLRTMRAAEELRMSVARMGELRDPLQRLGRDLRVTGATVDELRRR